MTWATSGIALMWLTAVISTMSAAIAVVVLGYRDWLRGVGAITAWLMLLMVAAGVRIVPSAPLGETGQWLYRVLWSLGLSCLLLALRQFRHRPAMWAWLAIPPLAVLAWGLLPQTWHAPYGSLTILLLQALRVAIALWHMRALRLGIGYYMLITALPLYMAGIPLMQCNPQPALLEPVAPGQWLWCGSRWLAVVCGVWLLSLGFIRMVRDRREARSCQTALRDPLTGLLNQRALAQTLELTIPHALHHGRPLAVLLAGVDHFQQIHDTHGHVKADQALCHLGRLLAGQIRADTILGRHSRDTFIILCPETTLAEAQVLARRLNQAVRQSGSRLGDLTLQVTTSIGGFAGTLPADATGETLLQAADDAMHHAQAEGGDRVVMQSHLPMAAHAQDTDTGVHTP